MIGSRSKVNDVALPKKLLDKLKNYQPKEWKLRPEILCGVNIPKPLHGVAPRVVLGNKWWDQTRKAAYASTDFHCIACGSFKYDAKGRPWLEGHEIYNIDYQLGRMIYVETVPLCHFCHNYIHDGRLQYLLEEGLIHHAKYVAIIQHGDEVLRKHNLERTYYEGFVADWQDWRLVVDGVEYPPIYHTREDWERTMKNGK